MNEPPRSTHGWKQHSLSVPHSLTAHRGSEQFRPRGLRTLPSQPPGGSRGRDSRVLILNLTVVHLMHVLVGLESECESEEMDGPAHTYIVADGDGTRVVHYSSIMRSTEQSTSITRFVCEPCGSLYHSQTLAT